MTVLVADGSENLRSRVSRMLREAGHRVATASDADEARSMAAILAIDLLVADVDLPGGSGIDLFRELRTTRPELCGIALAARTSARAAGALNAGFSAIISKPVSGAEFMAAFGRVQSEHPCETVAA